jgi:hypothetical protein
MRWRLPTGWLGKLGLLGSSVLFSLLLLEIALRLFLPQQLIQHPPELLKYDPDIGWRYARNWISRSIRAKAGRDF